MPMGLSIVPMKKGRGMGICLLEEKICENDRAASDGDF
jgi:hypothetical protein